MSAAGPAGLLQERRIVVCVGTGGVGKTTVSAALALAAARAGRRALVLTIDPARRLADALGAESLGGEASRVAGPGQLGIPEEGSLDALMLDMKGTFDALVRRFAESPEAVERILSNPIYQHVSDALAGSAEYAAMEKVHEVAESGRYDVIVLDTPPSQHALDFLESPKRLLEFLESRIVQVLLHPAFAAGRLGFRIFQRAARRVLGVIERVTGLAFLEDVSEFLLAFEGMSEGFRERATLIQALLRGPQSGFVLVAGPSAQSARAAADFLDHLERAQVPLQGVLLNRVRQWPDERQPPLPLERPPDVVARLASALEAAGAPDADAAARAALDAAEGYASLVDLDRRSGLPLRARARERGLWVSTLPELAEDVHDESSLVNLARRLVGAEVG